jgi:Uma2 family endonuclease
MAVATLVPIEAYLSTSWDPDREYVDGRLVERNVGEYNHGFLELIIGMALRAHGLRTYVESRLQIRPGRFLIPDVMALAPCQKRSGTYQQETPYIVVEIVSPDDRISEMPEKLQDYFEKNVPNVWVVDPRMKFLTVHHPDYFCTDGRTTDLRLCGRTRHCHDTVQTSDGTIGIDVREIFRQLAEDQAE